MEKKAKRVYGEDVSLGLNKKYDVGCRARINQEVVNITVENFK